MLLNLLGGVVVGEVMMDPEWSLNRPEASFLVARRSLIKDIVNVICRTLSTTWYTTTLNDNTTNRRKQSLIINTNRNLCVFVLMDNIDIQFEVARQ